jgi:PAS domain S-box-containing protein
MICSGGSIDRTRQRGCVLEALLLACLALHAVQSLAQFTPPAQITVVTDDNYPPYLFRDSEGRLQGIVKDKWELWSTRTGVAVKLDGMEWSKAQHTLQTGGAEVIDAIARNPARALLYEFSPPWGQFESRVFFHRSVAGISDVSTMRGFTIGSKEGSSCSALLRQRGIDSLRSYPDSEALVRAAGAGEIRLFCLEVPVAQYYLFKQRIADDFRQTPPLNAGEFHWAVAKGQTELRDFVQGGFGRISAAELQEIDERWTGNPVRLPIQPRYFLYAALVAAALFAATAGLALWNRALSRRVAQRTHALGERVKELAVLHSAARLFQDERAIDRGLIRELALLLPPGWQFPEICVARIVYGDIEERTPGWRQTQWRQSASFDAADGPSGLVEVAYLEERPFLAEERTLIDSVAELLGANFGRIRIQDALRESEARLTLSVRASGVGLWDWDIAGNKVYFSPEWKSMLGYGDEEIPVRMGEWNKRLHPEDRARGKLQALLRGPSVDYENEFRMQHKDGSYRWIYARGELERDAGGKPLRLRGGHLDITERKRAENEVRLHAERLRALSQRLMDVEEAERRNINRELHDSIAQNLSALQVGLVTLRMDLSAGASRAVQARIDDAQALIEDTSSRVRDVMAVLRPAALDDFGLLAALRDHGTAFSARTGIMVAVQGRDPETRLPLATETALFRIVQEALNNVSKHARARSVQVKMDAGQQIVRVTVSDDGAGFDAAHPPQRAAHYGIATMRERAEAVGATLSIESAPGRGTRVEIELFLPAAAA